VSSKPAIAHHTGPRPSGRPAGATVRAIVLIASAAAALTAGRLAAQPASVAPTGMLDEVLVTGEQPGPGMWRVSKGDHELWILGTLTPLPKKMIWRSQPVEARIAKSQVVLSVPSVSVSIGFFQGLTLIPSLLRARKNPGGQTLEQVLPHNLYVRWLALKVKYLGHFSGDEHLRPMLAAHELYMHAIDESGLTSGKGIWEVVKQSARRNGVPITPVTLAVPLEDPKGKIRELGEIPHDAEVACLATTVERLETDLQGMRQRANLWSRGDVEGLRALPYPDERAACFDAVVSVPELHDRVMQVLEQRTAAWLAAAESALDKNESSVAVLPITELVKPDGWLARLRSKGYEVQDP
jgi:uncharacterized protein YbaP (TraB family)